jgi:hypothetical protein
MATIERVLPTGQTETEYFNEQRVLAGLAPTTYRITKIREGLHKPCGTKCVVSKVGHGWFSIDHGSDCVIKRMPGTEEIVGNGAGQQVCGRIVDLDGTILQGVLVLSGLFPYELLRNAG